MLCHGRFVPHRPSQFSSHSVFRHRVMVAVEGTWRNKVQYVLTVFNKDCDISPISTTHTFTVLPYREVNSDFCKSLDLMYQYSCGTCYGLEWSIVLTWNCMLLICFLVPQLVEHTSFSLYDLVATWSIKEVSSVNGYWNKRVAYTLVIASCWKERWIWRWRTLSTKFCKGILSVLSIIMLFTWPCMPSSVLWLG